MEKPFIPSVPSEESYIRNALRLISRTGWWVMGLVLLIELALDLLDGQADMLSDPRFLRVAIVGLVLGFCHWKMAAIPYRILGSIIISAFVGGFLLFPILFPYVAPIQSFLLIVFLIILITLLPYPFFHLTKDIWWIVVWQLGSFSLFIWGIVSLVPELANSPFAALAETLNNRPILMVGYGGAIIFIHLVVIQYKRTHYQQRGHLQEHTVSLQSDLELIERRNGQLNAQYSQLQKLQAHLKIMNYRLEQKVRLRSKDLKDQNLVLMQYNYMFVHLMRPHIASIKGLMHLLELETIPEKRKEVRIIIDREYAKIEEISHSVSDLLNNKDNPIHQQVIESMENMYQPSDKKPMLYRKISVDI